jgi:hypothetical protein
MRDLGSSSTTAMIILRQMLWDGMAARGGGVQLQLQGTDTHFTLGDPGQVQNAPAEVTQPRGDAMDLQPRDNEGGGTTPATPGQATQATTMFLTPPYPGMSAAVQKWGIGDTVSQGEELVWQREWRGTKPKSLSFRRWLGLCRSSRHICS